jgi:hypothetical protein
MWNKLWGCLLLLCVVLPGASALDRIVGDSLSASHPDGTPSWPELAFDEAMVNRSIGGASTYDFVSTCQPHCLWTLGSADDTWWILLGNNDHRINLEMDPQPYLENMLTIADMIEARTGGADLRLISSPYSYDVFGVDRSAIRAFRDAQALVDDWLCANDVRFTCVADLRLELSFPEHFMWDGVHFSEAGTYAVAALIPEPATASLVALGLLYLAHGRRRSIDRER